MSFPRRIGFCIALLLVFRAASAQAQLPPVNSPSAAVSSVQGDVQTIRFSWQNPATGAMESSGYSYRIDLRSPILNQYVDDLVQLGREAMDAELAAGGNMARAEVRAMEAMAQRMQ